MGFEGIEKNSFSTITFRGELEAKLLFTISLISMKLSRISEELIWLSYVGLIELPEEYCTGSSIMLNKKNPDSLELIRGKPFTESFMEMTKRIQSETFAKTVRLIVEGTRSGGNLSELLGNTALDIRRFKSIRKEVSATVLVYQLFVFAAAGFGGPALYSVALFLIKMVSRLKGKIQINADIASQMPLLHGTSTINIETVFLFAIGSITVTSFFGSLTAGVIGKGKESEGIIYIPILLFVSYLVFFLGKFILENMLSGLFYM